MSDTNSNQPKASIQARICFTLHHTYKIGYQVLDRPGYIVIAHQTDPNRNPSSFKRFIQHKLSSIQLQ